MNFYRKRRGCFVDKRYTRDVVVVVIGRFGRYIYGSGFLKVWNLDCPLPLLAICFGKWIGLFMYINSLHV